jgi:hypothetical protein
MQLEELQGLAEKARQEAQAQRDQAQRALQQAQLEAERRAAELAARVAAERRAAERAAREAAARRKQGGAEHERVSNDLKQLAIAMHNYHDTHKAFPPAAIYSKDGKPLLSWRVAILPYIEQEELYKQFRLDEPWDSPHNKKLLAKMPKVFAPVGAKAKPGTTHYRVFTGPGTVFEGKEGVGVAGITDGTSNTILMIEAAQAVPWTKPDELPFAAGKPLPKLGAQFKDGFYMALCDGSVRFVPTPVNEQVLRDLITRNGGEAVDFDKLSK